ncbi:MAG TPA: HEAT repeat domain-containing protein [Candidatus Polarisedimenticolaceae bacterium]|nr:HEAT repeat domain-containing protein [Candidatus Polarisedimenticolaceae bacterium]
MRLVRTTLAVALLALGAPAGLVLADADRSTGYREAQRAIEHKNWAEASRLFGKLAAGSSGEIDAALYWKAYADWKQQDRQQALQGLDRLLKDYPKSSWADDAKVLQQDIRGPGRPASEDDEELKLYALDGLMQMDADQAVPVLEKMLAGNASVRLKERALFVLSQSDSPRAREILLRTARSGQPLELRKAAIRTLGIGGLTEELKALGADSHAPVEVREAVIQAYLVAGESDALLQIARSDPDPRMRGKAIQTLGAMGETSALRQLWSTEKDPELRAELLRGFGVAGDVDALAKAARESKDAEARQQAIRGLGIAEGDPARKVLRQLYGEFNDPDDKRQVAQAFMVQGDAKSLIELFRAETDPAMKRVLLQQLTLIDDPEANRLILDVLGD